MTGIHCPVVSLTNKFIMLNSTRPTYMTRKEVAEELRCTVRSVINYEQKGWLKAYRRGRTVLYRCDEIDLLNFPQGQRA